MVPSVKSALQAKTRAEEYRREKERAVEDASKEYSEVVDRNGQARPALTLEERKARARVAEEENRSGVKVSPLYDCRNSDNETSNSTSRYHPSSISLYSNSHHTHPSKYRKSGTLTTSLTRHSLNHSYPLHYPQRHTNQCSPSRSSIHSSSFPSRASLPPWQKKQTATVQVQSKRTNTTCITFNGYFTLPHRPTLTLHHRHPQYHEEQAQSSLPWKSLKRMANGQNRTSYSRTIPTLPTLTISSSCEEKLPPHQQADRRGACRTPVGC